MTGRSIFQSTPPARGATRGHRPRCRRQQISIHAPCEGGDFAHFSDISLNCCISIHAPCEGGDVGDKILALTGDIISIHAPCEGGDAEIPVSFVRPSISIHAPCEGGDRQMRYYQSTTNISIHAPCEGGDAVIVIVWLVINISIHAPCEGGDRWLCATVSRWTNFNPRPLRGGRRLRMIPKLGILRFQSTPPARGATAPCRKTAHGA